METLGKCEANYVPLTPLTFLKRAGAVYADRTSIISGGTRFTWGQTYERCRRLAYTLRSQLNVKKNNVVSALAPNIPALYEMHFAVPMAGCILNAINTRLDANTVATILRHSEAKLFFVDHEFVPLAREALQRLAPNNTPRLVVIRDIDSPTGVQLGGLRYEYEQLLMCPSPELEEVGAVEDEWDPIALNYTSGTTAAPKGVVYSHRSAYLSTLSLIVGWEMGSAPVYLWTLPMFHCNGWTFTWGVAARGGTNVCIRTPDAQNVYRSITLHGVTHMCCAPILFNMLLEGFQNVFVEWKNKIMERKLNNHPVRILTGGASPPEAMIEKVEALGFHVTHAYGMTEATGPALVCEWQTEWDELSGGDKARLKTRQGVSVLSLEEVDVKDPVTMVSVPHNGKTKGEIVLRGSGIMKGYLKDVEATRNAFKFANGNRNQSWFMTGDVAVVHQDGYIEIKDRSKDVIISGGENISSVEVESVIYRHPQVKEAAVVAMPHPRWGESPCAFVVSCSKGCLTEVDVVSYCRKNLPRYVIPRKVVFVEELPKTPTGKIQKFQLRALAKTLVNSIIADDTSATLATESKNQDTLREKLSFDSNCRGQTILTVSRL